MADTTPAANSLDILEDGIIKLTQVGFQTRATAWQFQEKIDALTAQYHTQGKKVFILVDISGVTGHDPETRAEALKRLKGDYDAMAICGTNPAIRMIVNWLIASTGGDERIKFFATTGEALAWLRAH